jgi:putative component of membrane protein insertase Oxa1/YidC/SpoIIIJ protein YidD
MLKRIALAAIGLYQRYLSPRKGYSCAYRVRAGGVGCSGFGKHALGKHGLLLGLVLLRRRMAKCAWQSHQHAADLGGTAYTRSGSLQNLGRFSNQAGFVDCDCGSCDVPNCDLPDFGCGAPHNGGSKTASSFCFIADCGNGCSSCGSGGSGYTREEKRLARANKRRKQGKRKANDSDSGDFDIGDGGDGD